MGGPYRAHGPGTQEGVDLSHHAHGTHGHLGPSLAFVRLHLIGSPPIVIDVTLAPGAVILMAPGLWALTAQPRAYSYYDSS